MKILLGNFSLLLIIVLSLPNCLQDRQYTAYVMSVQCGGDTWTLRKRYSEFEAFYHQIRGQPSAEGIGFPSKGALTGLGIMWGGAAAQAAMQQQLVQRLTGLNDFVAQVRYLSNSF